MKCQLCAAQKNIEQLNQQITDMNTIKNAVKIESIMYNSYLSTTNYFFRKWYIDAFIKLNRSATKIEFEKKYDDIRHDNTKMHTELLNTKQQLAQLKCVNAELEFQKLQRIHGGRM